MILWKITRGRAEGVLVLGTLMAFSLKSFSKIIMKGVGSV